MQWRHEKLEWAEDKHRRKWIEIERGPAKWNQKWFRHSHATIKKKACVYYAKANVKANSQLTANLHRSGLHYELYTIPLLFKQSYQTEINEIQSKSISISNSNRNLIEINTKNNINKKF